MKWGRFIFPALLAVPWVASLSFIGDEWAVHAAQRDLGSARKGDQGAILIDANGDTGLPPRAALLRSLTLTQTAVNIDDPTEKARLLKASRAALDRASTGRPGWGEASVARAYAAVVGGRATDQETIRAFAQSYVDAPYLRGAVVWRLRYGAALWDRLDATTRRHVLDEAIWLSLLGQANYMRAWSALHGTAALGAYLDRRANR